MEKDPWALETEDEEEKSTFNKVDWEKLTIEERVSLARYSGLEGKLGSKPWELLNHDEVARIRGEKAPPESYLPEPTEFQIKAHVALIDSDKEQWGIAEFTEGDFGWAPGEGQPVGTWSKSPVDGIFHVFLETPLAALQDRAVQSFKEHAERRSASTTTKKTRTPGKARVRKEPEPEVVDENLAKISALRNIFKRK